MVPTILSLVLLSAVVGVRRCSKDEAPSSIDLHQSLSAPPGTVTGTDAQRFLSELGSLPSRGQADEITRWSRSTDAEVRVVAYLAALEAGMWSADWTRRLLEEPTPYPLAFLADTAYRTKRFAVWADVIRGVVEADDVEVLQGLVARIARGDPRFEPGARLALLGYGTGLETLLGDVLRTSTSVAPRVAETAQQVARTEIERERLYDVIASAHVSGFTALRQGSPVAESPAMPHVLDRLAIRYYGASPGVDAKHRLPDAAEVASSLREDLMPRRMTETLADDALLRQQLDRYVEWLLRHSGLPSDRAVLLAGIRFYEGLPALDRASQRRLADLVWLANGGTG